MFSLDEKMTVKNIISYLFPMYVFIIIGCSMWRLNSEDEIRNDILEVVPIGSDTNAVREYANRMNYEIFGFYNSVSTNDTLEIGDMIIRMEFAEYRNIFFLVSVGGDWYFDAEGKLIDLVVTKESDGF